MMSFTALFGHAHSGPVFRMTPAHKLMLFSAVLALLLLFPLPSVRAAATGANLKASHATSPAVQVLEDLRTARALAKYGERRKDALALIVAARMTIALEERSASPTRKDGKGVEAPKSPEKAIDSPTVAWLARAKTIAGDRADLIALADDVASGQSRGGGHRYHVDRMAIKAGFTDRFMISFHGGVPAAVAIIGEDGAHLDLFVDDENGKQVCAASQQDEEREEKICRWTPLWNGPFSIRVVNRGVATEYRIVVSQR